MPAAAPRLWTLRGVRAFAAGTARGREWTERDIDCLVENGKRFAHQLTPSAVIGHEERQDLTEGLTSTGRQNTGEPSYGWVTNPRKAFDTVNGRRTAFLEVDVTDVPEWLASLVRRKAYRKVSAELYEQPPEGLEGGSGPVLRRLAILGGEIPQIKTLGDLPDPVLQRMSEAVLAAPKTVLRWVGQERSGKSVVVTFSEVEPVAKRRKFKHHAELTPATKAVLQKFADAPPGVEGDAAPESTPAAVPQGLDRQAMLDALADLGADVSAITPETPDQVIAEMLRVAQGLAGDQAPQGDMSADATAAPAAQPMADGGMTPMAAAPMKPMGYAEVQKQIEQAQAELAAVRKQTAEHLANAKKANFQAFCEVQKQAGRLLPAELDAGLTDLAMELDAVTVHKFSDGEKTLLDKLMAVIAARPKLVKFGERFATGPAAAGGAADEQVAELKEHYLQFSESYRKARLTEEQLVTAFESARKTRPSLTAKEWVGAA